MSLEKNDKQEDAQVFQETTEKVVDADETDDNNDITDTENELDDIKPGIWTAAFDGDLESVNELLSAGRDVNTVWKKTGENVFHASILGCQPQVSLFLLEHQPTVDTENSNNENETPFLSACRYNQLTVAESLVLAHRKKEVDVNHLNANSCNALDIVVSQGHIEILKFILNLPNFEIRKSCNVFFSKHISKTEVKKVKTNELIINQHPFLSGCYRGFLDIIKLLHDANKKSLSDNNTTVIDINAVDLAGNSGLHHAIMRRDSLMIKYLTSLPDLDANQVNNAGHTPFLLACFTKQVDVAQLLLHKHVNINAMDNKKNSALHLAVLETIHCDTADQREIYTIDRGSGKELTIVQLLIRNRIKLIENENGKTAKHLAERAQLTDVVLLIEQYEDDIREDREEEKQMIIIFINCLIQEMVDLEDTTNNKTVLQRVGPLMNNLYRTVKQLRRVNRGRLNNYIREAMQHYITYSDPTNITDEDLNDRFLLLISRELRSDWKVLAGCLGTNIYTIKYLTDKYSKDHLYCTWTVLFLWKNAQKSRDEANQKIISDLKCTLKTLGKKTLLEWWK